MLKCDDRGPVFVVEYCADMTVEELRTHHEQWNKYYETNTKPFAWILVLHGIGNAEIRAMVAAHSKQNAEHIRKYMKCTAVVIKNALARGAMTAVFWTWKPEAPWKTFATTEEAVAWARTFFEPGA